MAGDTGLTLKIGGAEDFKSSLAQIDAILGHIDERLDSYAASFDKLAASLDRLAGSAKSLTSSLGTTKNLDKIFGDTSKVEAAGRTFEKTTNTILNSAANLARQAASLGANFVNGFLSAFSRLDVALGNLDRQLVNAVSRMGANLQAAGTSLAQQGLFELSLFGLPAFFGSQIVKTASDFNQVLKQIELINSALDKTFGPEQMAEITKGINEFAQRTIFTSSESAAAFLQVQKAGFGYIDTLRILNDAGNLAASDGTVSLEKAQYGLIQVMKLANLTAQDTTRIADSTLRSANNSQASVNDLIEGWGNLGPIGTEFGLSMEQINAVLSIFNDRGVRGAEAGTQFRSMLSNMIRPTEAVQGALKTLGISLQDANGDFKDIDAIIGEFQSKTANLTEYDKVQALRTIAGAWGQIGLSILTGMKPGAVEEFIKASDKLPDSATTAANMMKTFKGAVENLRGSLDNLMNTALKPLLEDFLAPIITSLVGLVNHLIALPQPVLNAAAAIIFFTTGLTTIAAVGKILLGLFAKFGGMLVSTLAVPLKAVATILLHPLGLIAGLTQLLAIITTIGAVVGVAVVAFEALRPIFEQIATKGTDLNIAFEGLVTNLRGLFGDIAAGISEAWGIIRETWDQITARVQQSIGTSGVLDFFYSITNAITAVRGQVREFFDWLTFQTAPNDQGERAVESPLSRFIRATIDAILEFNDIAAGVWDTFVKPLIDDVGVQLKATWDKLKDIDPEKLKTVFSRIGELVLMIGGGAALFRVAEIRAIIDTLPRIADAVAAAVDLMGEKDATKFDDNLRNFLDKLGKALISFPFELFKNVVNQLRQLSGLEPVDVDFDTWFGGVVEAVRNNVVLPILDAFAWLALGLDVIFSQIAITIGDWISKIPGQDAEEWKKKIGASQISLDAANAAIELDTQLRAYFESGQPIIISPNIKLDNPDEIAKRLTPSAKKDLVEAFGRAINDGDYGTIEMLAPIALSPLIDVQGDIKGTLEYVINEKLKTGDLMQVAPILQLAQDLGIQVDAAPLKAQFQDAINKAVASGDQNKLQMLLDLAPLFNIDPAQLKIATQEAIDTAQTAGDIATAPGTYGSQVVQITLPAEINFGEITIDQAKLDETVNQALVDGFQNVNTADEGVTNAIGLLAERTGLSETIASTLIQSAYSTGTTSPVDLARLLKLENPQDIDTKKFAAAGIYVATAVIDGAEEGLAAEEGIQRIREAAGGIAAAIKDGIGGPQGLDISSPSKWAEQTGIYVGQGLYDGILFTLPLLSSGIQQLLGLFYNLRDSVTSAMLAARDNVAATLVTITPSLMNMTGQVNALAQAWNSTAAAAGNAQRAMQNAATAPTPSRERANPLSSLTEPVPYRGLRDSGGSVGKGAYGIGTPELLFQSGKTFLMSPGAGWTQPLSPINNSASYDQSMTFAPTIIVEPGGVADEGTLVPALDKWWDNKKRVESPGRSLMMRGKR